MPLTIHINPGDIQMLNLPVIAKTVFVSEAEQNPTTASTHVYSFRNQRLQFSKDSEFSAYKLSKLLGHHPLDVHSMGHDAFDLLR